MELEDATAIAVHLRHDSPTPSLRSCRWPARLHRNGVAFADAFHIQRTADGVRSVHPRVAGAATERARDSETGT